MTRLHAVTTIAVVFIITIGVVLMTAVVRHSGDQRLHSCVTSGGSYIKVPNTAAMECRRW